MTDPRVFTSGDERPADVWRVESRSVNGELTSPATWQRTEADQWWCVESWGETPPPESWAYFPSWNHMLHDREPLVEVPRAYQPGDVVSFAILSGETTYAVIGTHRGYAWVEPNAGGGGPVSVGVASLVLVKPCE